MGTRTGGENLALSCEDESSRSCTLTIPLLDSCPREAYTCTAKDVHWVHGTTVCNSKSTETSQVPVNRVQTTCGMYSMEY